MAGPRRTLRSVGVGIALVASALGGCGTTVSGRMAAESPGGPAAVGGTANLDVPGSAAGAGTTSASSGLGGAGTTALGGGASAPGPAPSSLVRSASAAVQPPGTQATGPATPVQVGIVFESNLGAAYAAAGLKGATGASDAQVEAWLANIVAAVNARGGFAGHPVRPVFHGVDPSRGSFDQASQEACTDLTEDHHVVAVIDGANVFTDALPKCLAQHGVPMAWDYQYLLSNPEFRQFGPYLYQPAMVSADRLGTLVDALASHGFFGTGAKVGLLRWDTPGAAYFTTNVLRPRLAAHGIPVVAEFAAATLTGESDAGHQEAQMSDAVLQFRSKGVTHVLFSPTDVVAPWMFMTDAESQGYRPKYGITSMDIPNFLVQNAPAAQVANTSGIGWTPPEDLADPRYYPTGNAERARCLKANVAAGQANAASLTRYCDGLFFFEAAFDTAGSLAPLALEHAVGAMGSSYRSPWTLTTAFPNGRHDGPSSAAYLRYDASCPCFRYADRIPLP